MPEPQDATTRDLDQEVTDLLAEVGKQYEEYLRITQTASLSAVYTEAVQADFNWDNPLTWEFSEGVNGVME